MPCCLPAVFGSVTEDPNLQIAAAAGEQQLVATGSTMCTIVPGGGVASSMLAFWTCAAGPALNTRFNWPCIDTHICCCIAVLVRLCRSSTPIAVSFPIFASLTYSCFHPFRLPACGRCVHLCVQPFSQQCAISFASSPHSCCRPSCAKPTGGSRAMSSWTGTQGTNAPAGVGFNQSGGVHCNRTRWCCCQTQPAGIAVSTIRVCGLFRCEGVQCSC